MRAVTAQAVNRAGLALQEALRAAEDEAQEPGAHQARRLATELRKLERVARVLLDVPMPPPTSPQPEFTTTTVVCSSCGVARILTPLSGRVCPACGAPS